MKKILLILLLPMTFTIQAQKFKTSFLQGEGPSALYYAHWDYDNDGDADLVSCTKGGLDLYTNDGNGVFTPYSNYLEDPFRNIWFASGRGMYPAFGDIDKDGDQDILVSYLYWDASKNDNVTDFYYYENADGVFTKKNLFVQQLNAANYSGIHTVTLDDWDGDGDLDAIIATSSGNVIYSEFNSELGGFGFPELADHPFVGVSSSEPSVKSQVILVNPDGDEDKDILFVDGRLRTTRYFQNDEGTFNVQADAQNPYTILDGYTAFATVADFDGDLIDDIWSLGDQTFYQAVNVFIKGTASGYEFFSGEKNPFANPMNEAGTEKVKITQEIGIADLNNNGSPELYAIKDGAILKFDENGIQSDATNPFSGLGNSFISMEFFDWDNDNDLDLFGGYFESGGKLRYYQNDGGTFTLVSEELSPVAGISTPFSISTSFADFNGDGFNDLVLGYSANGVVNEDPGLFYYQNDQSGNLVLKTGEEDLFAAATASDFGTSLNARPEAGDINGDGFVDLVVGTTASGNSGGGIRFFLNNGDNTYNFLARSVAYNFGLGLNAGWANDRLMAELYDIDKDGTLDIFATNRAGSVALIENTSPAYVVSENGSPMFDGSAFTFPDTQIGMSSTLELHFKPSNEGIDVLSTEFNDVYLVPGRPNEFEVVSIDKSNPNDIIVNVTYSPSVINYLTNQELTINTNDPDGETFKVRVSGKGLGAAVFIYESINGSSYRNVVNNGFAYVTARVQPDQPYSMDLYLMNSGNEPLVIDVNSLVLPAGVTLSESTPIIANPASGSPSNQDGTKLTFTVDAGNQEAFLTGQVSFTSNDRVNDPFSFRFYFADVAGLTSPAQFYIPNLHVINDGAFLSPYIYSNSTQPVTLEVIEGADLVQVNGLNLNTFGKVGVAKIRASVADDPAKELTAASFDFFVTIVEDLESIVTPVVKFDDMFVHEGDAPIILKAEHNSTLPIVTYKVLSGQDVVQIDGGVLAFFSKVGVATIEVTVASSGPFATVTSIATLTVAAQGEKFAQQITFDPIADKTYGDIDFDLNASSNSGLPVSYAVTSGPANLSGSRLSITGAGEVTIEATQMGDETYNVAAPVQAIFSIAKVSLIVTADDKTTIYFKDIPILTAAYAGFVLGEDESVLITEPIISTTATDISDVGSYDIVPSGGVSDNYDFSYVNGTLIIEKASQLISVDIISNQFLNASPITISASTSSELDLGYEITGPATLEANAIILDGTVGTITVILSQSGGLNYNAASDVEFSFEVTDPCTGYAIAETSVTHAASDDDGAVDITVSGGTTPYSYDWSNGATTEDLVAVSGGVYSVTVTDENSCSVSLTVTINENVLAVDESLLNTSLKYYPNPAKDQLNIELLLETATEVEINLIDISGRSMLVQNYSNVKSLDTVLELQNLKKGQYLLLVIAGQTFKVEQISIVH